MSDLNLFLFFKFYSVFLVALGLCGHTCALSSRSEWGLSFIAVHGLFITVVSLVTQHRLQACSLQYLWHVGSIVVAHRPWSVRASAVVVHGLTRSVAYGLLPDQRLNPCPLHWQVDSYPLYHERSPWREFDSKAFHSFHSTITPDCPWRVKFLILRKLIKGNVS